MKVASGKILHVDLTSRTFTVETPPELFYRRYLGGRGIIAYYLLKEVPVGADPFGPDNVLVFAPSVVTGALLPGTSRFSIGALSPLTGGYGEAESGGAWGPELKFAGLDAIVIKGSSPAPVYLFVHDGQVEFHDASPIWGKDTGDAQAYIWEYHEDPKIQVAGIGQAGEHLVRFAAVMSEARHAGGRSGIGAIMGSKKLKAVAVRGTRRAEFADPETIKALKAEFARHFRENADDNMLHQYGTSQYFLNINVAGLCPTRNFQDGAVEGAERVGHLAMHQTMTVKSDACPGCSVACKRVVSFKDGDREIDPTYGGPEFETMTAFSAISGNNDLYAMVKANELCNRYGLDTIATGNVIAFSIECYEKGFLTNEDTGGLELRWGDSELMLELVQMIAFREGFGNWLADGVYRLSQRLGPRTEEFAMHVKGQEFPMHDPRGKYGVALAYALSPTGADHLQHEHDGAFDPILTGYSHESDKPSVFLTAIAPLGIHEPVRSLSLGVDKVRLFTYLQQYWSMFNMLDLCIFTFAPVRYYSITQIVEIVRATTGWDTSLWEIMKAGERGLNMTRIFNLKHGLSRRDDKLPERMFQGIGLGAMKGNAVPREDFEKAIPIYYAMMGWDPETGIPTRAKLSELQLDWTAEQPAKDERE